MSLHTGATSTPPSQAAALPSGSTLTGADLPQAKNVLHLCVQGLFSRVQHFVTLWTVACQASLSGKRFFQTRILEHIGQYWLSFSSRALYFLLPSCQLPLVPGAARTPVTQAAAPPLHLALTEASPSPPGQPQEQTPVDDPHA